MLSEAGQGANWKLGVDEMMGGGFLRAMMGPRRPVTAGMVVCRASFHALASAEAKPTPRRWVRESGVRLSVAHAQVMDGEERMCLVLTVDGCGNADSNGGYDKS